MRALHLHLQPVTHQSSAVVVEFLASPSDLVTRGEFSLQKEDWCVSLPAFHRQNQEEGVAFVGHTGPSEQRSKSGNEEFHDPDTPYLVFESEDIRL